MVGFPARDAERLDCVAGADDQLVGAGALAQLDRDRVGVVELGEDATSTRDVGFGHKASFRRW